MLKREQFGDDFEWGVTISAFQNEGWSNADGKGPSIWDTFTSNTSNINNADKIGHASNFYKQFEEDIKLASQMGLDVFRFSISWTRILPNGTGTVNAKGIAFYNKVIECCLSNGLKPYVTLYHWDLPQVLHEEGGWTNRQIVDWFLAYTEVCVQQFGDRVKHWVVMNEPMTFTGLGYFMGYHAPASKGIINFLMAAHHAVLCMAQGGRLIRKYIPDAQIGVALSCSYVKPVNRFPKNVRAAKRMEALLNRFFIEPLLGMGYPTDVMPALKMIHMIFKKGDEQRMHFDFDFIGLQYYFRVVARHSLNPPILFADEIPPVERKAILNTMNLDVYPKGLNKLLHFYAAYPKVKSIVLSESGVCFPDFLVNDHVYDTRRLKYHQKMLRQVKKAINQGLPIKGYFVWTLVDNFEWKEGFEPRFGLVYVDFKTQKRTIKHSGNWFREFLKGKVENN
jgi:beta-glucosidase